MGKKKSDRSAATARRLKMYNDRPKRNSKGKIIKHEFQSKKLPSTRIQPDSRWFGNTRVIGQKELQTFREEIQNRITSNYKVILNEKELPMSLSNGQPKQAKRKRPKHSNADESDVSQDAPPTVHAETGST